MDTYFRCKICRRNFMKQKHHVYSETHMKHLSSVLKKMKTKVNYKINNHKLYFANSTLQFNEE